jgi:hypothetical protein
MLSAPERDQGEVIGAMRAASCSSVLRCGRRIGELKSGDFL